MSRKTLISLALTVVLLAYLVTAVILARDEERNDMFTGLKISVNDSTASRFIDEADIDRELDSLGSRIARTRHRDLNTLAIEKKLRSSDKIEDASCVVLNNGMLLVDVTPMQPVARVFTNSGLSYYINNEGKKIGADARYHVDVPVVSGNIHSPVDVEELLPMFDFIKKNPEYNALVTGVVKTRRGDLIVVPAVAGHVVNLGDTSDIADKFSRLRTFYHEVMPVKGWEYYDTLSLKWRGRLVATRRQKGDSDDRPLTELDGVVDEVPDDGTMDAPEDTKASFADSLKLSRSVKKKRRV